MPARPRPMSDVTSGEPRVFRIADLEFRANSAESRSARAVTNENTGARQLLAGMFWSGPGSVGGWAFGPEDPHVDGAPYVGTGEEVYLCLAGRLSVEWEGGTFEFGAGDIVFWPNGRWFRTKIISDEPVNMFYCMAPPPTSMWGLGERVTTTGNEVAPDENRGERGERADPA